MPQYLVINTYYFYKCAAGLLYQWGRKDPFTFATKSSGTNDLGINPLKIYNAQGKEIVQTLNGLSDTNGGTTIVKELASSMLETVRKPNVYYAADGSLVSGTDRTINDYYWTSYSRGTDGGGVWQQNGNPNWNNIYLDVYNQQRSKSLFDPCPYGFRAPANGTYNKFVFSYLTWKIYSYVGGLKWISSHLASIGGRSKSNGLLWGMGDAFSYYTSTLGSSIGSYVIQIYQSTKFSLNFVIPMSEGWRVRCIEECNYKKKSF